MPGVKWSSTKDPGVVKMIVLLRERLHFGKPHCSVERSCQIRKVIPGGVNKKKKKKKVLFRFSALLYLWANLFFFFFSSEKNL